jgi:hypothetical protein
MTPKTKAEAVKGLLEMAGRLDAMDKLPMEPNNFTVKGYFYDKASLMKALRDIGGSWKKEIIAPDEEYSMLNLVHQTLPITLVISRVLTYKCEPLFSPEEEKDLEVVNV